jgi:tRNA G46 methylase TrmB
MSATGFTKESTILDIGSGFGKAVIDFAISTPMLCIGYEMVDVRAIYSQRKLDQFKTDFKDNVLVTESLNRVQFHHLNVINAHDLKT